MMPQETEASIEAIRQQVQRDGIAIVRPPDFRRLCEQARADYLQAFKSTQLQPMKRAFRYGDLARAPWRKLAIGSTNGVGEPYAQFLQTTYFDSVRSPYGSLNRVFRVAIELRNQLMGVDPFFGDNPETDGFWNACRVHHYPSGGGFMTVHRDTYFPLKLGDYSFYQLLIPLSVKGKDFNTGGGVVIDSAGTKRNTDDDPGMGSVIVYDGRTMHGVEDVDADEIVSFDSPRGRLAAVSNLYVTPKE